MKPALVRMVLAAAVICSTAVVSMAQQTQTTSTETKAFEVLTVYGNQVVARLPEGVREVTVPEDFRFTVNGKPLSVHELKPGMKGTATITTRTTVTPVTVTEIKSGRVMQSSGATIIVQTDEGFKSFTQGDIDKRGVKIVRDGKPATISDFRSGDVLTATIVTSKPPTVMTEREVNATIAAAAPGAAPATAKPAGAAAGGAATAKPAGGAAATGGAGAGATASGTGTAKTLPKTASSWPAILFASLLSLAIGLGLTFRRRFVS